MFLHTGFWNSSKGPFISGEITLGRLDLGWFLEGDQALSLWSGSTESKTLDNQKTNSRECQIVRTHTKETTWIQDSVSPNHQWHTVQDVSSKQQTKVQTQSSAPRITTSLSLAHQGKNKQKLSTNLTLYEAYTNHWTNLRRAETKRKKELDLETWAKMTSNTVS